jgi:LysR family transcriptional activator of glutamate synthase operon
MEIYQVEYFLALLKSKQFSKAAEDIFVSQSTLSHGIKKLEEELGVALFIRTPRNVQLTKAGKEFTVYAKEIVQNTCDAKTAIGSFSSCNKGCIRIGTMPVISYSHVMPIIAAFQIAYPNITLEIYEDTTRSLLKKLVSAELDVAVINYGIYSSAPSDVLECYKLVVAKLVLLVPQNCWLAKKKTISISELKHEKFLLEKGQKSDFIEYCKNSGFEPNIVAESNHALTLKELIQKGIGIAPLANDVAMSFLDCRTAIVDVTPVLDRITGIVFLRHQKNAAITTFHEFVMREIAKENDSRERELLHLGG